ncbi:hypothetical protein NE865_12187 [Phthorimaea operculella]|nr:hypothetical protein NE865_12187 [Phthorimaea operculella]
MSEAPPLMLCLEKADGQEVSLQIHPTDDFHTFLVKARSLVGYEVDINCITQNQPVNLTDNIYQFLLNSEQALNSDKNKPTANKEDMYILDDGTQICASQIHFDNEDPPVDLTAEKIPFVKYNDVLDDPEYEDTTEVENKMYSIVDSPVRYSNDVAIPFKLLAGNPLKSVNSANYRSGFEAQFTKYLEVRHQIKTYATLNTVTNRNKSPRSLIRDNFKSYDHTYQRSSDDFSRYTREDILNMFKDAPVSSAPIENQGNILSERRRHARKSDPTRIVQKNFHKPISYIDVDGVLIAESESQNCFICSKFVDNNHEKLYLFDNEDQKLHRSSPQKKLSTQLKIICEQCLEKNFKSSRKTPNQSLNPDEYLVIKNNQQYIVQKINSQLTFHSKKHAPKTHTEQSDVIINGEVVNDEVIPEETNSSDVEIIENEPEFEDIDNLEEADEEVIEFLGKYQCDDSEIKELKCRFCAIIFGEICEVIEHGYVHKHEMDDGDVFPCPLCEYGYADFKWLKGHLKAAHGKTTQIKTEVLSEDSKPDDEVKRESPENGSSSPVAKRTRSAIRATDSDIQKETPDKQQGSETLEQKFEIKMEVKQEALDSSDEEIWIVQAADDADKQAESNKSKCDNCSVIFTSTDDLTSHRPRKKKGKEPSSDPQIVTCHNCNESFTSKVRLKFHMQFHESTSMRTADGYTCTECDITFPTETALFDHVHFQHHKQRNWQCPVPSCGKTFYLSTSMRTADGYTCTECDITFPTETALFDHVHFQHHKQRNWQCPVASCGKTFYLRFMSSSSSIGQSHDSTLMLRLDGEYTCTECEDNTFPTETALFDHVHFQHHKQRNWQCPVASCGKTFYLR